MEKDFNYILVYIGTDNYIFRTTKNKFDIIDINDFSKSAPTEEFLRWFDEETEHSYDADALGEMVVTWFTGDFIVEY